MSAPKLISPLLDNFVMGEPFYDQNGIRVLPAMEEGKEERYIVKIVSIPANQNQVDALLITGAYKDAESVNQYFAELAEAIIQEAGVLTRLSNAGGFDGYVNTQVVPMDDGNGYDVYLLAPYRPTWERICQQKPITHLDAYNMALDICAALSVARRNGYLYANLKPESISVSPNGSYRICDLGLLNLNYLQYSSLPTTYFSAYTAPEVADAYSSLNCTLDVYALGMMLYEAFNGSLPARESGEVPLPIYADEELAQIILKAIHADPAERWQDPTEMGQAIVSVMQRNGVSDAPIIPVVEAAEVVEEEPVVCSEPEELPEDAAAEDVAEETIAPCEDADEALQEDNVSIETASIVVNEDDAAEVVEEAANEPAIAVSIEENRTDTAEETEEDAPADQATDDAEIVISEAEPAADEEAPVVEAPAEVAEPEENLDDVLEEADKLIAELEIDPSEITSSDSYEQLEINEIDAPEDVVGEEEDEGVSKPNKSGKRKLLTACLIILLSLLIIGGLFFYRHVYMQEIDVLSVSGKADTISVAVVTDIDSNKLSVVCKDANGNTFEEKLVDYKATITGLPAETDYTVSIKIDGFHKLFGDTEYTYTTPVMTTISDIEVLNGVEAGTAEVIFQISGPNEGNWTVIFTTAGEAERSATAINGKAVITGLTLGKTYTVTLSNSADLYIGEYAQPTFTPGDVIKPISPYVASCSAGKLVVKWTSSGNEEVTWKVRCYNGSFDQTVNANDTVAEFDVPDTALAYTIEISAVGQSSKEVVEVAENAITFTDFTINTSLPGRITLSWNANADVPADGYVVTYTVDGVDSNFTWIAYSNTVTILNAVPNAEHIFSFATANGDQILSEKVAVTATGENPFSAFGIKAANMRFNLCPRPAKSNWAYKDVSTSAYTTTFTAGQKASVAARILSKYYTSDEVVATVYVFKNTDGEIVHVCSTQEPWGDMWSSGYGAFDIPSMPDIPGSYKLDMYIDGGLVHQTNITIK